MRPEVTTSYVRDLLEHFTGSRPEPDDDGDLPLCYGDREFFVRIVGQDAVVQVFAVAVAGIDPSGDLMHELNDINTQLKFSRMFWVAGQVLVEHDIWGDDVNPANLRHACVTVAEAATHFGGGLIERFGGEPQFSSNCAPQEPVTDEGIEQLGLYL
jgi:hypothetical protein